MAKKKSDTIAIKKTHFYTILVAALVVFAGLGGYVLGSNGSSSNTGTVLQPTQGTVESVTFTDLANDVGLDVGEFESCLESDRHLEEVRADQSDGVEAGVSGTPTFFIGNPTDGYIKLVGAQPYSTIKQAIEAELSGTASADGRIQVSVDDDPFLGDENAPVTVIEFSDFECPFCQRAFGDAVAGIKSDYIDSGQVRFVYRDFPLSFHPMAEPAAEAAECANEQGMFWEYHDALFETQGSWSR